MASSTKIKLSPITNLSDARFAAAAGIEYMGFCFDPSSPDFLLPIKAREILEWTSGSHAIGEFGDQSIEEISELSELLQMDVVLLNNSILPDELPQIAKPIIKAISLDDMGPVELANELCAYAPYADAFQLNGTQAIAARKDELIEACAQYKIVWNLPYTNENVLAILETYKPYSLVILAASEEKTGMKEYDELNEMLEILRP
jgi:phosphoribosylanthranilate isomerase